VTLHVRSVVPSDDLHLLAYVSGAPEATGPDTTDPGTTDPGATDPGRRPGRLVGYAHLDPTDLVTGPVAELVVHPQARRCGVGNQLLRQVIAAGGRPQTGLRLWAHGAHPGAVALAASLGFTQVRRLLQMRRSLLAAIPPANIPAGMAISTFRVGRDEDAWLALNAKAFGDHPEQGRWTLADLQARLAEDWFEPEGFFLARPVDPADDPGSPAAEPIGFHWTKIHGTSAAHGEVHEPIGEVYVVGVDPHTQGTGLGRALTLTGLQHLRARGLTQVMLYVDADNLPARSVYERLGFTIWDEDVMFLQAAEPDLHVNVTP